MFSSILFLVFFSSWGVGVGEREGREKGRVAYTLVGHLKIECQDSQYTGVCTSHISSVVFFMKFFLDYEIFSSLLYLTRIVFEFNI